MVLVLKYKNQVAKGGIYVSICAWSFPGQCLLSDCHSFSSTYLWGSKDDILFILLSHCREQWYVTTHDLALAESDKMYNNDPDHIQVSKPGCTIVLLSAVHCSVGAADDSVHPLLNLLQNGPKLCTEALLCGKSNSL